MLIDSHAHLASEEYGADLEKVVARAREAGLVHIVLVGQWPRSRESLRDCRADFGDWNAIHVVERRG